MSAEAACSGKDTAIWFPTRGDNGARAKRLCAGCPVRVGCLVGAVERGEQYGVWGGSGETERRSLRRAWCIGGPAWDLAVAGHFAALDRATSLDANGTGATHGRRVTYARGCRCPACSLAAVTPDRTLANLRRPA